MEWFDKIKQETIYELLQSKLYIPIPKICLFELQSILYRHALLAMENYRKKSIIRKFCYCAYTILRKTKKLFSDAHS